MCVLGRFVCGGDQTQGCNWTDGGSLYVYVLLNVHKCRYGIGIDGKRGSLAKSLNKKRSIQDVIEKREHAELGLVSLHHLFFPTIVTNIYFTAVRGVYKKM